MSRSDAIALIGRYYAAFNAGDATGMLDCVAEDVEHRVNEGGIRRGRAKFAEFCGHMGVSYREELKELVQLGPRHFQLHAVLILFWQPRSSQPLPYLPAP